MVGSLQRVYGRGSLLSILETERIITKVSVLDYGRFAIEAKDWDSYWQPVRELNCEDITLSLNYYCAWISSTGKSVIGCLAEKCNYILIEDADLRPQDLIDHATKFSLVHLAARDVTRSLKLRSNYLYLGRTGE